MGLMKNDDSRKRVFQGLSSDYPMVNSQYIKNQAAEPRDLEKSNGIYREALSSPSFLSCSQNHNEVHWCICRSCGPRHCSEWPGYYHCKPCVLILTLARVPLTYSKRYYDGQMGACGCGTGDSSPFSWQQGISSGVYTAAASQAIFGSDGSTWCGSGCGKCYKLTSTGNAPCSGCGTGGASGQSIIVMVTNLCPYNGNQQWCPNPG